MAAAAAAAWRGGVGGGDGGPAVVARAVVAMEVVVAAARRRLWRRRGRWRRGAVARVAATAAPAARVAERPAEEMVAARAEAVREVAKAAEVWIAVSRRARAAANLLLFACCGLLCTAAERERERGGRINCVLCQCVRGSGTRSTMRNTAAVRATAHNLLGRRRAGDRVVCDGYRRAGSAVIVEPAAAWRERAVAARAPD